MWLRKLYLFVCDCNCEIVVFYLVFVTSWFPFDMFTLRTFLIVFKNISNNSQLSLQTDENAFLPKKTCSSSEKMRACHLPSLLLEGRAPPNGFPDEMALLDFRWFFNLDRWFSTGKKKLSFCGQLPRGRILTSNRYNFENQRPQLFNSKKSQR